MGIEGETQNFKSEKNIKLNLDEFDLDSYDFKPVTKGLGFHDPLEKGLQNKSTGLKKSMQDPIKKISSFPIKQMDGSLAQPKQHTLSNQSLTKHLQNTPTTATASNQLLSGIDAFYSQTSEVKKEVKPKAKKKKQYMEATFTEMFFAYVLDCIIILSLSLILFACFFGMAFEVLDLELLKLFLTEQIAYFGVFLGLLYLSYFTMLEPVGTFGKKAFRLITLRSGKNERIRIKASFIRAVSSALSLPLLGLPSLFDFQGKLSDSVVMKRK